VSKQTKHLARSSRWTRVDLQLSQRVYRQLAWLATGSRLMSVRHCSCSCSCSWAPSRRPRSRLARCTPWVQDSCIEAEPLRHSGSAPASALHTSGAFSSYSQAGRHARAHVRTAPRPVWLVPRRRLVSAGNAKNSRRTHLLL
jgi:hypothetical protein